MGQRGELKAGLKLAEAKSEQSEQKNLPAGENFFYNLIANLTFCDSFKLVQRDFCGESITFVEITLAT